MAVAAWASIYRPSSDNTLQRTSNIEDGGRTSPTPRPRTGRAAQIVAISLVSECSSDGSAHRWSRVVGTACGYDNRVGERVVNSSSPRGDLDLGGALRRVRQGRQMSHVDLARAADINRWYLSQLERGARCRLGWSKLCDLATALNVSVSLLLQEAEAAPSKARALTVALPRGSLPAPNRGEIGPAIRHIRRAQGVAIIVLAEAAGLHRTSLSCIERGKRQPGWSTLCVLAEALDVRVSTLAAAAEAKTPKGHSAERE